ncbi:MAG: bifunctional UDP-N-acetylglucosamine diphosphorylase/glucosamine-1-phosphate N-acetyltransferase GlmU [Caulobacterales bacterium]
MSNAAPSRPRAAIILAAGQGTRMKSALPKVMHKVGGRPMLGWSIGLAWALGASPVVVVTASPEKQGGAATGKAAKDMGADFVAIQDPPLGTGHAVRAAESALAGFDGDVAVLFGDSPLITAQSVAGLFDKLAAGASVAVLGFEPADPAAYGRLVLAADGGLDRIVEFREANDAERAIGLCNSGVLAAPAKLLFELLTQVRNDNSKGEYYLTDVIGLARARGLKAAVALADSSEVLGVNSRVELAEAEASFQTKARRAAMEAGATLISPETVFFSADTAIGADVIIEPNVIFGAGVSVADNVTIRGFSHIDGATIEAGAIVGPFARLRPGAEIGPDAHVGNFVEIKKAKLGAGAKVNHLTYIGDAIIGARANIGAGTITCNYDGFDKYLTEIGEDAFIGSDTALVAPVKVGDRAMTGSGSVITQDVPADALAVARGPQVNKEGWAAKFRAMKAAKKP